MHEHRIVRTELYRYIRHPAYLGAMLMSFGGPLVLGSIHGFY
ncbi:MAG: hypothetical protein DRJ64_00125 [Thermoprotei archaeon]|nr:MAG: hypothetical protein DRJ64_00125 [Thermoprotei archaeon]